MIHYSSFYCVDQERYYICLSLYRSRSSTFWRRIFESLPQTVSYVRRELVLNAYYLCLDPISLLDFIGALNLSDNDFVDKQYRARATRLSALFGREFSTLFGRAEQSETGRQPASTHSLPLTKLYASFDSPDNKSGFEQQILKEVSHVISSLSSVIT